MPGSFKSNGDSCIPLVAKTLPSVRAFRHGSGDDPIFEYDYYISGVTRDLNGNPLGGCTVTLYRTSDNSVAAIVLSDGSGNFRIASSSSLTHYIVAYLPGSPDVAGTTLNTLVGTAQ